MIADPAAEAEPGNATGRPTTRLPNRELVRISLYWLGLSSIFAGLSFIMAGRLEFTGPRRQGRRRSRPVPDLDQRRPHRGHRPADDRLDLRLHDLALGPPQAVHLHRLAARPRLPDRHRRQQLAGRDRGVHRAPPVQLELRPGPVPGVRARPRAGPAGRDRQRARRPDAGPRRRVRLHHRGDRGRRPPLRARTGRPRRPRGRHDAVGRHPGPRGPAAQVARGPPVARDRGRGVGHRHPPRAQLPVAGRLAAGDPDGRLRADQPGAVLPGADDGAQRARHRASCSSRWSGWSRSGRSSRSCRPRASPTGSAASASSGRAARSAPPGWPSSPARRSCRSRSSARCCTGSRPGCSWRSTGRS